MAGLSGLILMLGRMIRNSYVSLCGGSMNVCMDDSGTIQNPSHSRAQIVSTNTKAIAK